ncbi:MAG: hypothetical protein J6K42_01195 [Clostridia bacterium]|nr:hypothetical protein [Clostridia bacterium]
MIDFVSQADLRKGDILVSTGHIEIYVGNGQVFSCGSINSMKELESSRSIEPNNNTKIIRIK